MNQSLEKIKIDSESEAKAGGFESGGSVLNSEETSLL
jgi:hypothetical protein